MTPSPSRLYVDLIYKQEERYASWEPSRPIKLGDYGRIRKASGEFKVEGNIFDEGLAHHLLVKECVPEKELKIVSKSVKALSIEPQVGVTDVAGFADCQATGRWRFSNRPSAILMLIDPALSYIDKPHLIGPVMSTNRLKDCAVVTDITTCTAYAMGMENRSDSEFALGFQVSAPGIIPAAPGITPSIGITGQWKQQGAVGMIRKGVVENPGERYIPLFRLMALSPKYKYVEKLVSRGTVEVTLEIPLRLGNVPNDAMTKYYPPWGSLDSDGETDDDSEDDNGDEDEDEDDGAE